MKNPEEFKSFPGIFSKNSKFYYIIAFITRFNSNNII